MFVLAWANDPLKETMVAFSAISIFQVRFPASNDPTGMLHLTIVIRDQLDCIVEFNLSSVIVVPDSAGITDLINDLQGSSNEITNNPIIRLLAGGNQNTVGQVITALSQQFNQMNSKSVENAASSNMNSIRN